MPSIKLILRTDKVKSNGEAPIYIRLIVDRKPTYKSLGLSLLPKYWDEQRGKVKVNHPHSVRFNHTLLEKVNQVSEAVLDTEVENGGIDALNTLRYRSTGFLEYAHKFILRREKINKPGMIRRMKSVLAKVETYLHGKDIGINSINIKWLSNYEQYLLNQLGNSVNTVASNMSGLRTVLNEATREGVLKYGQNPFDVYNIRKKEVEIEYLTDDELDALKKVQLKSGTRIALHRDLFVFASHTAGIRVSDLLTMKWKHFDGERLKFTTRKTGQQMSVKLGGTSLEILDRLPKTNDQDSFLFGLLPDGVDIKDDYRLLSVISSANAYMNKNLGIIAKKAGIEKHLHFHMSRHTWATRMLRRGMRMEHISKLLGHKSIRTTQVYAKIVNADLDEAIDKFND